VQRPTLALLHNLELHQSLESINLLKQASKQARKAASFFFPKSALKKKKKKTGIDEENAPRHTHK
jgi:hypothetical protein